VLKIEISEREKGTGARGKEERNGGMSARVTTVVSVPQCPSGLGWLRDNTMLVVSMLDRRVLRYDPVKGTLNEHSDLSSLASFHCNDMVVDKRGRAYVGNFGFNLHSIWLKPLLLLYLLTGWPKPKSAELICVEPCGKARVVATGLTFPNGTVITPDGGTLIVAETFAGQLTAFDVSQESGSLSNRRIWAKLPSGALPDGMCLDEDGGIWVASITTGECLRLVEGADGVNGITNRVKPTQIPYACMLGGKDGKTLHILTARTYSPGGCRKQKCGRVEVFRAPHARAGWP